VVMRVLEEVGVVVTRVLEEVGVVVTRVLDEVGVVVNRVHFTVYQKRCIYYFFYHNK
jgi:hypothetical protein